MRQFAEKRQKFPVLSGLKAVNHMTCLISVRQCPVVYKQVF